MLRWIPHLKAHLFICPLFQLNVSWATNDRKVVAFMMPNALRRREKSIVTKHVPSRAIQCVDMTASHKGPYIHVPYTNQE